MWNALRTKHSRFALTAGDDVARTQLGFIRRKLSYADVYFVTNTSPQTIDATASFGTNYKSGAMVDPDSTASAAASATAQV